MKKAASLLLVASLMVSLAGCGEKPEKETSEETTTETTEETTESETEETSEETTTEETTEATIESSEETEPVAVNPDAPSVSFEDDEARYAAFFENEYAGLDDSMYWTANSIPVRYAYADLDGNGSDELLFGDDYGVYCVVTEIDGSYDVANVNGWRIQYGATPGEYIGNGCFVCGISNGNNYGGEFSVDVIYKYSGELNGMGIVARLSGSWDPDHPQDNLSMYELYVATDENALASADDVFSFSPSMEGYEYSVLDYGDNLNYIDGELDPNELQSEFMNIQQEHTFNDALATHEWRLVSERG